MKISKLFHWLYGFLMLLPVFGVLFKVGYVMLNDNAFESYSGAYAFNTYTDLTDIQSNLLSSVSFDNIYRVGRNAQLYTYSSNWNGTYLFSIDKNTIFTPQRRALLFTDISNVKINGSSYDINCFVLGGTGYFSVDSFILYGYKLQSNIDFNYLLYNGYSDYSLKYDDVLLTKVVSINVVNSGLNIQFTSNSTRLGCLLDSPSAPTLPYTLDLSTLVSYTKTLSYYVDTTLSSVFYASLQEINDTEFFSWAKDSFLVQPIMYIGNLFGITNPHPIFTFMSYWLAISIIWLVFDLVMYVPLLVHRWIDKGVIE